MSILTIQTNASTSLHLAAEGGHKDVVTVLLDAGADPLVENDVSLTTYSISCKSTLTDFHIQLSLL